MATGRFARLRQRFFGAPVGVPDEPESDVRDLGPHPARMTPMSGLRLTMLETVQEAADRLGITVDHYAALEASPMTDLRGLAQRAKDQGGHLYLVYRGAEEPHDIRMRINEEGYVDEIGVVGNLGRE